MGESICLVRSFSQPAEFSSHEIKKEFSHRVLTESVSFGRFASETLSWEKWSAFNQNRYLEEVERFTKPGSVAQKKAIFETHFKNRAAGRVTQTNIEEVNVKTSDKIECEIPKDILVDSEVPFGMAKDEVSHAEAEGYSVVHQTGEVKATNVENLISMAVPEVKAFDEANFTSLIKEGRQSSSGSKACCGSLKLEPSVVIELDHSPKNTRQESSLNNKGSVSVSKNQSRPSPQPVHMPMNKTIVEMPQNCSRISTTAKSGEKADKKKRSGPSLVHMSLNFASSATKKAPKPLGRNYTTQETTSSNSRNKVFLKTNKPTGASISCKGPLSQTSKEGSKAAKCLTSTSAVTLPKLPPLNNQQSESKRKNISVRSSVSGRISNNAQRQPSVGGENLSTHSRPEAKSLTVSSPFIFRSDERAEKRKELGKKKKKEDAAKEQFSCGFKENQNTHLASEEHKKNPQLGVIQAPLINMTSPRFRRNQTPGTENIEKSQQNPHPHKVSSMKIINAKRTVIEKHKSCKMHPASRSQTTKKTR